MVGHESKTREQLEDMVLKQMNIMTKPISLNLRVRGETHGSETMCIPDSLTQGRNW